ncbi:hypothetical protein LZZ90_10415 [Flavobacterium sp. SM15]|uniref:hypothetical protein n=1 Tax=Flavobacterium sp. SM15 TaxID=2908005 RepID=UPI001EDA2041|nr:hypothetical protein [Flavobacterium sp. SM15]MCG2611919.1 hypothetical protein [Flavobacterium sp. SM15]
MKKLLVTYLLLLFNSVLFAQTELVGVVFNADNTPLSDVEIVNITKKTNLKSAKDGKFTIKATVGDELVFLDKNYNEKRIYASRELFNSNVVVKLDKKVIELKEVAIEKSAKFNIDTSFDALKMQEITKKDAQPKVIGVYTGEIQYGMDFVAIGKKLYKFAGKLLGKSDEKEVPKKIESFNSYVRREFPNDFFITKLNLKENEIDSFITFCENDLKAQEVTQKNGTLDVLEFMLEKRKEYKN